MTHLLLAADKNPMAFYWVPHVTTIIVFTVVLLVLAWKVWPRITAALDAREAKLLDDLRAADEAREQAKSALADYERSLAQARKEAAAMIAQAKSDAQAVANELRARNEEELAELRKRAMRDIQAAQAAAVADLHAQAANLAAAMARKILEREITPADQQRLMEESLREFSVARRG